MIQHLDKCTDPCSKLLCVAVRIICLDTQYRNACVFQRALYQIPFCIIQVTELQVDINDTVSLIAYI